MRIAILSPGYPSPSDPYNWAFVHARAKLYRKYGHEVTAVVPGDAGVWSFEGIEVRQGPVDELPGVVIARRPHVLAVHGPYRRVIAAAYRIPVPRVVWIHGHEALWEWGAFLRGMTPWARLALAVKTPARLFAQMIRVRRFIRASQSVVFVSTWMKRAAEQQTMTRYPHAVVIPNPVDVDLFRYAWDSTRLQHGITARSLNSRKYGVDLAIRAISRTHNADLLVAGTGALEGSLRALAGSLRSRVTFSGGFVAHDAMPGLYRQFGFFVAASRVEAQGVAMCEAMATGLPVVATRVGGIPEFVRDRGGGTLVPPGDWKALAAAIDALLADPGSATEQSRAARQSVLETCSAAVVIPKELDILAEAAR